MTLRRKMLRHLAAMHPQICRSRSKMRLRYAFINGSFHLSLFACAMMLQYRKERRYCSKPALNLKILCLNLARYQLHANGWQLKEIGFEGWCQIIRQEWSSKVNAEAIADKICFLLDEPEYKKNLCFGLSKGFNPTHCNHWHTNYELSMYAWIHSGNFTCRAVLPGFDYHSSQSAVRKSCCLRTWRVKWCRSDPRTHSRWFLCRQTVWLI